MLDRFLPRPQLLPQRHQQAFADYGGPPARVLLIDDDEDEYILTRGLFAKIPPGRYELEWTPTYQDGLKRLTAGGYDAALVDYRLGDRSGLELVREVVALGVRVPLVMLTGAGDAEVDIEAQQAGAADYLVKGRTDPVLLDRTLRYALAQARAIDALRRQYEQMAGVEAIGRLLGTTGSTTEVLEELVDLLVQHFGYQYVSVYVVDSGVMALGAYRGYRRARPEFEAMSGAMVRVMQSKRPVLLPNATVEPDDRLQYPKARMELCVPILDRGEVLGLLNIGSTEEAPVGEADQTALVAVADRLGAAFALARERRHVADRAACFRRLGEFAADLGSSAPEELYDTLVTSASRVVAADSLALAVRDPSSGRYVVRAAAGQHAPPIGSDLDAVDETASRAVAEERLIADHLRTALGVAFAASVPIMRRHDVLGALTLWRWSGARGFDELEREALTLLAHDAALAIALTDFRRLPTVATASERPDSSTVA